MHRHSLLFASMVLLLVLGCDPPKPEPKVNEPRPVLSPTAKVTEPSPKSQPVETVVQEPATAVVEGSAEAAFRQTLKAFQEGRLDLAFDFLPESYQADVEQITYLFADKMDDELWSKGFHLVTKAAQIMRTKKSLILNLDLVKNSPLGATLKTHWDTIVTGIHSIATSEVADLSRLKRSQLKPLLAAASGLLQGAPLPKFDDVTVTTVQSTPDTATLAYRESKSSELKQVEFVKIEGKWLPKSIASEWALGIASTEAKISTMSEQISSMKPRVLQQFEIVNSTFDKLQQAKTPEEFNTTFVPLVFSAMFGAQLIEQSIRESASQTQRGDAIRINVNRTLDDDEQTRLKEAVVSALNHPDLEYEMVANDGKTRCRFHPVRDAQAVVTATRDFFAEAKVRWDQESKTINVELK